MSQPDALTVTARYRGRLVIADGRLAIKDESIEFIRAVNTQRRTVMPLRNLDDLKPAEIIDQVLREMGERRWAEAYQITDSVAKALGSHMHNAPDLTTGYTAARIQERYRGRVKRAMDKLADQGALIKYSTGRDVAYYTPEAWREEVAEQRRVADAKRAAEQRWQAITGRLLEQGYTLHNHTLSLDEWERLLDVLEASLCPGQR